MTALTVLSALLVVAQNAGVLGSFAALILTDLGETGSAVTVLKTVSTALSQSTQVDAAVQKLAAQIVEWCKGDTSYSAKDLLAQCATIGSQSETIQGL